jgi:hypothetical protein
MTSYFQMTPFLVRKEQPIYKGFVKAGRRATKPWAVLALLDTEPTAHFLSL